MAGFPSLGIMVLYVPSDIIFVVFPKIHGRHVLADTEANKGDLKTRLVSKHTKA